MPTLVVRNPSTGKALAAIPADDAISVRTKYRSARGAQPDWAALPLGDRLQMIRRFRQAIETQTETLARTLTVEMGKPITQSRNELKGLLPRLDFFLKETPRALRR